MFWGVNKKPLTHSNFLADCDICCIVLSEQACGKPNEVWDEIHFNDIYVGLSESEPATPEEESDDDFHLDGSPSDDDSGSDFEPEPTSRKRKVTPVKKKPKGAVKKSPKAAAGRGRGGGRSSSGKGRSRKDPSLSPGQSVLVVSSTISSVIKVDTLVQTRLSFSDVRSI